MLTFSRHPLQAALLATVAGITLTACDGTELPLDTQNCETLDSRTYITEALGELGATEQGVSYGHWQIRFDNGTVHMQQSDFILTETYECLGGEILSTNNAGEVRHLNFSNDLSSLSFNPLNGAVKTYNYSPTNNNSAACNAVKGNSYLDETYASWALSGASPEEGLFPVKPSLTMQLDFDGATSRVNIITENTNTQGHYDCATGTLHIHSNVDDATPMLASNVTSNTFTVADGDALINMELNLPRPSTPPPMACAEIYEPVCAIVSSPEPCNGLPCPAPTYETFGNECEAQQAGAVIQQAGECGELEKQPVTQLNMPCPANIDPVCAKEAPSRVCITEPCYSNAYNTYNNSCETGRTLAQQVYKGTCELLEDTFALNTPAATITATLPNVTKSFTVTKSVIVGDELQVTLGYSGCAQQQFDFMVDASFSDDQNPVVTTAFVARVNDDCEAYFTTQYRYDLLPIKGWYNKISGSQTGNIVLPDLGTYQF